MLTPLEAFKKRLVQRIEGKAAKLPRLNFSVKSQAASNSQNGGGSRRRVWRRRALSSLLGKFFIWAGLSEKVGILIHAHLIVDGYGPELFVGSALVDMYFKLSNVGFAHKVFDGILEPDTVLWNTVISGLVRNCFFEESLRIFKDMVEGGGTQFDSTTLPAVIKPLKFGAILVILVAHSWLLENIRMNFVTSLCRRLNLNELVTNAPVYSSASDITGRGLSLTFRRWATKKTAASTKNGRDSNPKFLGVKKFGGEVSAERNKFGNHVLPMKIKIIL
ncbi:hypothetical protein RHGRI_019035 [Rhododendron griersonianum]|uniref:Pentatricopeptide repeat-containing protein n=1 Tax=Rhododendron griersonianum TaxID=479676 RepID=A0AAV6JED2_9ERIC|nr:hypothetical protein RHGRI_019035 [Rhododendron griersonianum]